METFNLFTDSSWDLSSKAPLAVVHYPDSGKVGIWTQRGGYQAIVAAEPALDYWDGE